MTRGFGRFLRRNTVALLAVFLALGGTSYAAATLISGSQIKPHTIAKNRLTNKAIKQLKGNRGPRGLQGARGPTGVQGAQGIQGIQGPAGPFPQGNLPSGNTLKGSYSIYKNPANASEYLSNTISFGGFQMSAGLTSIWVLHGVTPPPHCTGSPSNPTADPGYLCLYESLAANTTPAGYIVYLPENPGVGTGSGRWGAMLFIQATGTSALTYSIGTWAATPPAGSSAPSHQSTNRAPLR